MSEKLCHVSVEPKISRLVMVDDNLDYHLLSPAEIIKIFFVYLHLRSFN